MGPTSPSGRDNGHYFYRAADIYAVDGHPAAERPIHGLVVAAGQWPMALPADVRAREVTGPGVWHAALGPGDRSGFRDDTFANLVHDDHLYIGSVAEARSAVDRA